MVGLHAGLHVLLSVLVMTVYYKNSSSYGIPVVTQTHLGLWREGRTKILQAPGLVFPRVT